MHARRVARRDVRPVHQLDEFTDVRSNICMRISINTAAVGQVTLKIGLKKDLN